MLTLVIYICLCVAVGFMGRKQPLGFLGYALLSFVITPLAGVVVLILMSLYVGAAMKKAAQQQLEQ